MRYLGVVITSSLKWNDHCQCIVQKATQSLNQLQRTMYGCTDKAETLAYLALVRHCLEYCSVVWTLHTSKNINLMESVESVQCRAAQWIKSSFDPSCCSGLNLVVSVSQSLDSLPWSYDIIMLVLCCFML